MPPTRLFWFAVGAASALWWEKHRDCHTHCPRSATQNAPVNSSRGVNASIPPMQTSPGLNDLAELGTSAGDKLADVSESTLDTVLSTVEVLKAKLAEHRAERQKEMEEERRRKEA
ncbi:hypothetical protein H0H92_000389 [Tricholoma furcatifolium]|nr:hypothetical protein H0H92_000389 [Tricholoma furcatifolium]